MRPPGTILMSYPFGFSEDYKGFLARSVLLPVGLLVAALYVAASHRRMSPSEHLDLLALALILASLPCFYHFEAVDGVSSPTYWGLVDSFMAAVGALGFATGYRAVQSGSWRLLALASLLTGLCLVIKPAGVIVALVIVSLLVVLKIVNDLNRPAGSRFPAQLVSFAASVSTGTGLLIVATINPHHLSRSVPLIVGSVFVALMVSLKFINDLNRPAGSRFRAQLIPYLITAAAGAGLLIVAAIKPHYVSRPMALSVALIIVALMISLKLINDLNRPFGRWFSLQLLPFVITISMGTGLLLMAALKSRYLSRETIQLGNQAVTILRSEFRFALSPEHLASALYPCFGLSVIVLGIATAVTTIRICVDGIRAHDRRGTVIALLNFMLAASVLAAGIPFWLVYADLSQVRYYYPFAFISLILLGIFLLDAIREIRAPYTRFLLYGSAATLFGGLTAMLYCHQLDASWHQTFGVNLTASKHREERLLADLLLRRAKTAQHDLKIFAMEVDWAFGAILSEGIATKIVKPDEPSFEVSFPVDWRRPSTVHLKDLVNSEYILFHPSADIHNGQPRLSGGHAGDLSAEITTISKWLTQANEDVGLKELATGKVAIKQVVNPRLFTQSIANWTRNQQWNDVFKRENADFLQSTEPKNTAQ